MPVHYLTPITFVASQAVMESARAITIGEGARASNSAAFSVNTPAPEEDQNRHSEGVITLTFAIDLPIIVGFF